MSGKRTWSDAQLVAAVASSNTWRDVLPALGLRAAGGNFATAKRHADRLALSTDHFDRDLGRRRAGASRRVALVEVLVTGSSYSRHALKRRLYAEGLKEPSCELCGQGEEWRGRPMTLVLDHVNGVHDDNRLENLQIVCPNCNATLDTHCGRNVALLARRSCETCGTSFKPNATGQRFCSVRCAGVANEDRNAGVPRPETRRVERTPIDQLLAELEATSYVAVGRKYGVSDNAVRKWVRSATGSAAGR